MTSEPVRLSGQTLRGIAHPLRVRLLNLLREDGPSTATRLAERTGQSSGATSYHLRQLATYGFVVEEPTEGGRERWWKASHRSTTMKGEDIRAAPEEAEAYLRAVAAEYAERVDRWLNEAQVLPPAWDRSATLSHWRLRLRAEEAASLLAELEAVIDSYRRDDADGDTDDEAPADAERVDVQLQVMPFLGRSR